MRAITPDDLSWISSPAPSRSTLACAVCGQQAAHAPVLRVPSMAPPYQPLTLFRCVACGSGFFDPPGVKSFADLGQQGEDFWRFYVEAGGGVWETIWPVLADVSPGRRSLLDVGCGFGFLVDYWRRMAGAEAVGVELADYGAVGAQQLGITVHRQLLEQCAPLAGRRFDIVHASEVIEHVPNPTEFLRTLAPYVADDGTLVLTTPCMDFVQPENLSATLLAALAPGFHGFLLSPKAFEDAARAAGFAHVEVHRFGERQILWASRIPRTLDLSVDRARSGYFAYLEDWFERGEPSSPLWQGYTYRYIRDLTNKGRLFEAKAKADRLLRALANAYGPAIANPEAMTEAIGVCKSLAEFGRIAPYFLPCLYFYLGVIAERVDDDASAARDFFHGSATLGVDCSRFGAVFFLEATSLIWRARAMEAWIKLGRQGLVADAVSIFERLARDGGRCSASEAYALASHQFIEEQTHRICQELAKRGEWNRARQIFTAYLTGLDARSAGFDWTDPSSMARLPEHGLSEGPADTVFPIFFQGLLDAASGMNDSSFDRLRALVNLASSVGRTSKHGKLLAEYAVIARRLISRLSAVPRTVR